MFEHTRARLSEAGFDAYEVSNFAGRGGPCLHNDHYWLQGDYVGVGPGASSHRAGVRATNLKALDAWCDAALAGLPCAGSAETLRPLQRVAEAVTGDVVVRAVGQPVGVIVIVFTVVVVIVFLVVIFVVIVVVIFVVVLSRLPP